jgi:formylglycine-generating enzyme required for sulfatase activity
MGSPETEKHRQLGELQRTVQIEKPFYIGMYEVTQAEYQKVMGKNPSTFPKAHVDKMPPPCARLRDRRLRRRLPAARSCPSTASALRTASSFVKS